MALPGMPRPEQMVLLAAARWSIDYSRRVRPYTHTALPWTLTAAAAAAAARLGRWLPQRLVHHLPPPPPPLLPARLLPPRETLPRQQAPQCGRLVLASSLLVRRIWQPAAA